MPLLFSTFFCFGLRQAVRFPALRASLARRIFLAAAGWGLLASTAYAQPNPGEGYLGAQACAPCHRQNFETQSRSGHAQALFQAAKHPLLERIFAKPEWTRPPDFQFHVMATPGNVRVQLKQGGSHAELPIGWAFGSGDQAVTFVSQLDQERYVEYAFSWYSKTGEFALTTGHPQRQPASLSQAMGITYDAFSVPATILACFQCHSTGLVEIGENYDIRPAELGVRCEVCHGPGREHVAAIETGDVAKAKAAIGNPARGSATQINELCGACHRLPPDASREFDFSDPWLVRHQPPYLAQSRCFLESSGALSCFTCHDPHEKLQRAAPESYNSRCATCHEEIAAKHPAVAGATAALNDCISCHMPKVAPRPDLIFTNHWIGVYQGDRLKPRR